MAKGGLLEGLEVAEVQFRETEHRLKPQNTLDGVDPLVKTCLVASANPTKPTYFMNPAVRAISRAHA